MEEEEEEEEMVMVSIDGPHEAWECEIYWFLVECSDEKNLVSNQWLPTDGRTDGPVDGHTLF